MPKITVGIMIAAIFSLVACSGTYLPYYIDPVFAETMGGRHLIVSAEQTAGAFGFSVRQVVLQGENIPSEFFKAIENHPRGTALVSPRLEPQLKAARKQFPNLEFIVPHSLIQRNGIEGVYTSSLSSQAALETVGKIMGLYIEDYTRHNPDEPAAGALFRERDSRLDAFTKAFQASSSRALRARTVPQSPDSASLAVTERELFSWNTKIVFISALANGLEAIRAVPESGCYIVMEADRDYMGIHPSVMAVLEPDYDAACKAAFDAWKNRNTGSISFPARILFVNSGKTMKIFGKPLTSYIINQGK